MFAVSVNPCTDNPVNPCTGFSCEFWEVRFPWVTFYFCFVQYYSLVHVLQDASCLQPVPSSPTHCFLPLLHSFLFRSDCLPLLLCCLGIRSWKMYSFWPSTAGPYSPDKSWNRQRASTPASSCTANRQTHTRITMVISCLKWPSFFPLSKLASKYRWLEYLNRMWKNLLQARLNIFP